MSGPRGDRSAHRLACGPVPGAWPHYGQRLGISERAESRQGDWAGGDEVRRCGVAGQALVASSTTTKAFRVVPGAAPRDSPRRTAPAVQRSRQALASACAAQAAPIGVLRGPGAFIRPEPGGAGRPTRRRAFPTPHTPAPSCRASGRRAQDCQSQRRAHAHAGRSMRGARHPRPSAPRRQARQNAPCQAARNAIIAVSSPISNVSRHRPWRRPLPGVSTA